MVVETHLEYFFEDVGPLRDPLSELCFIIVTSESTTSFRSDSKTCVIYIAQDENASSKNQVSQEEAKTGFFSR